MSVYIEVDVREFERAASAVEQYIDRQKAMLRSANQTVAGLVAGWRGEDYRQFQSKWQELEERDSTHSQLQKSLEDYAHTLRSTAELYKKAQQNALNRAGSL
jgi:Uncharacterized protein conserved in bacteria